MFLHVFKNYIKVLFKTKALVFWNILFPIILGTFFYVAFSSIYSSQGKKPVDVAVVIEDKSFVGNEEELPVIQMLRALTYEDDTKMINETITDKDEAEQLLKEEKVTGIIFAHSLTDISLKIRKNGMYESMLSNLVSTYRNRADLTVAEYERNPAKFLTDMMKGEVGSGDYEASGNYVRVNSLAGENKDPYIVYFYNLIAMVCLLGSIAELSILGTVQANESETGKRINVAPVNKTLYELSVFVSVLVVQLLITVLGLVYFLFGLKINFGGNTGVIFLTAILGTLLGCSLGFFVFHIGRLTLKTKNALLMWITLGGGFLAGLMMADMKIAIDESAPFVNKINPAAVITDAFYSFNMFGVGSRYYQSIMYMVLLTVAFMVLGIIISGRKKSYANL